MQNPKPHKSSGGFGQPKCVGGSAFPDGKPVCKPVAFGRTPKPLEGPVHPGFKGKPKVAKKPANPGSVVVRSDQTNDLYKPLKKVSYKSTGKKK